LSAAPDRIVAIGGGVLLVRKRVGREKGGEEEERQGRASGWDYLPPLYLTSGYGRGGFG